MLFKICTSKAGDLAPALYEKNELAFLLCLLSGHPSLLQAQTGTDGQAVFVRVRTPKITASGNRFSPLWEYPIDWKAYRLSVFCLYLIFFFLRIFFCQCFDIIAKTSKMFGRMASACFTEQPHKLGISVNLRLSEWSSCGARYRELEEQACLECV